MQDRSRQLDENLLQRTAGPYIATHGRTIHVGHSRPDRASGKSGHGPLCRPKRKQGCDLVHVLDLKINDTLELMVQINSNMPAA